MRSFSSSSAIDDFNVKVKSFDEITNEFTYPYDPLTKSCNTYSEYRMKKAVISGDSVVMPEDEFLRQHSFDENSDLNVDIQIKPQKTT